MRSKLFIRVALFVVCLGLVIPAPVLGQDEALVEYKVKAAFLYNFAKFVEWPDKAFSSSEGTFRLCVLGDDPFGPALKSLEGKLVRGRALRVIRCADILEAEKSHMVFIARSEQDRLTEILSRLKDRSVLTVSDLTGFAKQGGCIGFIDAGKKLRFEINPEATKEADLKVSSQLMKLAKIVR